MTTKRRPPRRGGRPKGRAEEKYIGLRTLFNHSNFDAFLNDERYDQTLMMALRKEHGSNNAETMATMKLGGYIETFKKKNTSWRKEHLDWADNNSFLGSETTRKKIKDKVL